MSFQEVGSYHTTRDPTPSPNTALLSKVKYNYSLRDAPNWHFSPVVPMETKTDNVDTS